MIFRKNKIKRSLPRKIGNGIIGFFVAIFILFLVFIAFSQTSTFREFLRSKIIEIATNSINGKLEIESVEGTIITQLKLKNVSLSDDSEQLFSSRKIEIAINPFYILAKRIKVTKLAIAGANFALLESSDNEWNISRFIKKNNTQDSDTSNLITKESIDNEFPFLIDVSNFTLSDVSFKLKKHPFLGKSTKYKSMNYDDIEISNLDLDLDLLADINKNEYKIDISNISFTPNLKYFRLQNLSGQIQITEKFAEVSNITILTDSSLVHIDARLDKLNLFGEVNLTNFKDYPISVNLLAKPISSNDLASFIEPLSFMTGTPEIEFSGTGKFGEIDFDAKLNLAKTALQLKGTLSKLNTPSKLYTKASFLNSTVAYKEVDNFLSGLELPKYPDLYVENINIDYEGEPLKFTAKCGAKVGNGNFSIDSFMDLNPDLIEYDFSVQTKNIDLFSTLGIKSKLNSQGRLTGNGFDPERSNSIMNFVFNNSMIAGHQIDTANINLQTIDKLVDLNIFSVLDSSQNEIIGKLDLANSEKPIYNLTGDFNNLNLFNFTDDSTLISNLNFNFDVNGHSLDLDKTEGEFKLNFRESEIGSNHFDSINFKIDLSKIELSRLISFQSDILDFNITGDFLLDDTFNLLKYQTSKISYELSQKLAEINPIVFSSDTSNTLESLVGQRQFAQKDLYLEYDFNFKDFKLIAALLNRDKVEISGKGYGYIENTPDNFSISATMDLDWLFLFKGKDVFYISGVESSVDLGADNTKYSFDNIFGSLSLSSERVVSDVNLNGMQADLVFNQNKAFINAEANLDDELNTAIEGFFGFSDSTETLNISNLLVNYKDFEWKNKDTIIVYNSPSIFKLNNFNLYNQKSALLVNGSILNKSTQNFDVSLSDVNGSILANKLFNMGSNGLSSTINLNSKIGGTLSKPSYYIDFSFDDFTIKDNELGSLNGKLNYKNKNVNVNIDFIDSSTSKYNKLLALTGNIPLDLDAEENAINEIDSNRSINLKIKTNGFNLASFGDAIPTIKNPKGLIDSDISIDGQLDDINLYGNFSAPNIKFTSAITNLDYLANLNLVFQKNKIEIVDSKIKNNGKTKFPGTLFLSGDVIIDGFSINKSNIEINGNLAILAPISRETIPNFFGDLQIVSENKWNFLYENNKPKLSGGIILSEVNLNFIPPESSYSVSNSDFKYIFVNDSTLSLLQMEKREKLLSALSIKKEENNNAISVSNLDLDIDIMSPNISKLSVVLSKTLNQKLIADITGDLRISNVDGQLSSQGQFDILPSSMFTFYKSFSASGNIKFTSDLSNPMINITSTYIADYINPRDTEAEPVKTAVKIKIDDSVKSLLANIASGTKPLDMKIYSGTQNIDYNVPNPQYTNLDAMYFILFGTFRTDAENASIAKSAGYSMLGSAFTSALNARLGSLVNNVNINQTGTQTRYNISGRYQQFRYTFGGSFEEISDMSQANAKVEYLFSPQFIMRVERKDPVISSSYNTQKINEFGVMYRFTF